MSKARFDLAYVFALLAVSAAATAGTGGLPGDHGRPFDGVMPANPPPPPAPKGPPREVRAPSMALALEAVQAIVSGCKRFHSLGVTVVNADGEPKLVYVPDGSDPSHGYMALRKAYTAVTFKLPTSQLVAKARDDAAVGARVKADSNLLAFSGGVLLKAGDTIVGAIGVSGAEPGGHDEECALIGVDKIKDRLQ